MLALARDIQVWVVANARWVVSAWRVWSALAVVAAIGAVALLLAERTEDAIRYSGLVLQLLGAATVVAVLRDKRRVFDRPSLVDHLKNWLTARPRFRPRAQVIAVGGVGSAFASGTATVTTWRGCAADAPVEERVAVLESNVATLRKELWADRKRTREDATKVTTALDQEVRSREAADTAIRQRVEAFGAGGFHIEATGLFWLIVGIVLGTIPAEIAQLFTIVGR